MLTFILCNTIFFIKAHVTHEHSLDINFWYTIWTFTGDTSLGHPYDAIRIVHFWVRLKWTKKITKVDLFLIFYEICQKLGRVVFMAPYSFWGVIPPCCCFVYLYMKCLKIAVKHLNTKRLIFNILSLKILNIIIIDYMCKLFLCNAILLPFTRHTWFKK